MRAAGSDTPRAGQALLVLTGSLPVSTLFSGPPVSTGTLAAPIAVSHGPPASRARTWPAEATADAEMRQPDVLEAEIALLALRPVFVVGVSGRPLKSVLDLIDAGTHPDQ